MQKYLFSLIALLMVTQQPLSARRVVEEVYVGPRHPVVIREAPVLSWTPAPEPVYVSAPLIVQETPPAELVEVIPISPGEGYVWSKGSWQWNDRWVWHKGSWISKPHPGAYWKPGHWCKSHHGWTWREGHWH